MKPEIEVIPHLTRVTYDVYAGFPAAGNRLGDLAFATDQRLLYYWNGVAWTAISVSGGGSAIYGDGSDGDITIVAGTELVRDMYYNSLTINTDYLYTSGYRVHVLTLFDNNVNLVGLWGGNGNGNIGGGGKTSNSLGGSGAGGNGAVGTKGGGGGSGGGVLYIAAKVIDNSGGTITCVAGNGAAGQVSYGSGSGTGGAGGVATAVAANEGGIRAIPQASILSLRSAATRILGGGGGGGGADDGGNGVAGSGTNPSLGGSGGAGGTCPSNNQSGGGGGGGGGLLVLVYDNATWGTEDCPAGTGGAGNGGGNAGAAGVAGLVVKIQN